MQNIDIVKNIDIDTTYRVSRIMADFDVKTEHLKREYHLNIELPEEWQIGLICGGSGTGKTTLAREMFKNWSESKTEFNSKSVIDDMPKTANMDEIEKMFYAVGFGSVPCWLKPYSVLSNGEQMRVQLAYKLLNSDNVLFDEFTSVVDRNVAKTLCTALNKSLKHYPTKKFVAVSCHKDIIEYLQPNWIFDTDTMQLSFMTAHARSENLKYSESVKKRGQSLDTIII